MPTDEAQLSLKERQRQERETLILQAAEEIFMQKGYYDASIDEIAARVGIGKGTFYAHFANKETLIVALIASKMEQALDDLDVIFATQIPVRTKLEMALQTLFTSMNHGHPQLLSDVCNGIDMQRILTQNGGRLQGIWKQMLAKITAVLEEGQSSGELNPALPSKVMLAVFLNLCSPHVLERMVFTDGFLTEDSIKLIGSIFFDGTAAKK